MPVSPDKNKAFSYKIGGHFRSPGTGVFKFCLKLTAPSTANPGFEANIICFFCFWSKAERNSDLKPSVLILILIWKASEFGSVQVYENSNSKTIGHARTMSYRRRDTMVGTPTPTPVGTLTS